VLLVACGGGGKPAAEPQPQVANTEPSAGSAVAAAEPPAPTSNEDVAIERMQQFETAICACADPACVQKVADEMVVWAKQLEDEHTEPVHMNEAQTQRANAIGQRMGECMQRAMAASGSGAGAGAGTGSSTP
jgi:hypothetical protein